MWVQIRAALLKTHAPGPFSLVVSLLAVPADEYAQLGVPERRLWLEGGADGAAAGGALRILRPARTRRPVRLVVQPLLLRDLDQQDRVTESGRIFYKWGWGSRIQCFWAVRFLFVEPESIFFSKKYCLVAASMYKKR